MNFTKYLKRELTLAAEEQLIYYFSSFVLVTVKHKSCEYEINAIIKTLEKKFGALVQ